ncbi:aminodeoxychorismate synthase component I [Microbacterium trichothecenolyticum]|uniref:aminodeoxychorismate synthase component I n=1 Tax=Microbacterium trichothecenolyticum TaxID=69370 RepID=UPI001C6E1A30|nr:aminodeoxychorismate synthase component I [Microbacterium trichothecenolyticum]MBW9118815.1 aminodeoxychorismate synthase component I [Microbacterium trichothecenolyticum]
MTEPLAAADVAHWVDPASVFAAVFQQEPHCFWLDAGPDSREGWSWIGAGAPADPAHVRATTCSGAPAHGDGSPFRGGWVGWAGYDEAAARAGAPASGEADGVAQDLWLRVERLVAFDHAGKTVRVYAPAAAVDDLAMAVAASTTSAALPSHVQDHRVARARHRADAYAALIERCRDAIREGDAYQLCLTTRFEVAASVDPVEVYARLRAATPAHHGGFVRSGGTALLSASPERFLHVEGAPDGGAVVRTRPIKGTRPRGADPASDAALAAELRASEKERAENVMIVDLMRNDLSRVCVDGTVGVDALLEVESYPAVHQLVSTVSGRLVAGTTVDDLLAATFPAGSMTGAPKLSAMRILHDLEGAPRGVFSGCFGWVGDDGALDLAMVIRSIVVRPDSAYVGAGGGITWRSDAAAEVAEVGIKARGPLAALGAELPPGW